MLFLFTLVPVPRDQAMSAGKHGGVSSRAAFGSHLTLSAPLQVSIMQRGCLCQARSLAQPVSIWSPPCVAWDGRGWRDRVGQGEMEKVLQDLVVCGPRCSCERILMRFSIFLAQQL